MTWRKCSFFEALKWMLGDFDKTPTMQSLALVWRAGNEWNVMDEWLLKHILSEMDDKTLRVVLWLTRVEAAQLIAYMKGDG